MITSLPFAAAPATGQPMTIYAQLQHDYNVTLLAPNAKEIPPGTSLMLIAHPENVDIQLLRQIEIWAIHGGKLLLFIDPMSELARQLNSPNAPPSSDFVPLLKGWGVQYSPDDVVLDRRVGPAHPPRRRQFPQRRALSRLWLHLSAG